MGLECEIDSRTGEEFCDQEKEQVERFAGGKNIINSLVSTIESYTYAQPE